MTSDKVLDEAIELLLGMVIQHCECRPEDGYLFSGFIGVNADAMRFLAQHGKLVNQNDNGGRVVEAYLPKGTYAAV